MSTEHGWPHHYDPVNPYTLRNRLGIADQVVLDSVEGQVSALRMAEVAREGLTGNFDFDHYCALHYRLLGDVYSWAGTPPPADGALTDPARDVVKTLGEDLSSPSIDYRRLVGRSVRDSAEYVFGYLQAEGCLLGLSSDRFTSRLAAYWCALSSLPIFHRGNLRTETVFFHQLCAYTGRRLDTRELYSRAAEFRRARLGAGSTRERYALFSAVMEAVVDHNEHSEPTQPTMRKPPSAHARLDLAKSASDADDGLEPSGVRGGPQ